MMKIKQGFCSFTHLLKH